MTITPNKDISDNAIEARRPSAELETGLRGSNNRHLKVPTLGAVLGMLLVLFPQTSGIATETTMPRLISHHHGGVYAPDDARVLTFDFSGVPIGTYRLGVDEVPYVDSETYSDFEYVSYDGSFDTFDWTVGLWDADYRVSVSGMSQTVNWTITVHPPLGLELSPRFTSYYPFVQDGFKDKLPIYFETTNGREAVISVTVLMQDSGELVFESESFGPTEGFEWWLDTVPPREGNLIVVFEATDEWTTSSGETRTDSVSAEVVVSATRSTVTDQQKRVLMGHETSSRKRSNSNCFFSGGRGLTMQCFKGGYAVATWRLRLPAGGINPDLDIQASTRCCKPGTARIWSEQVSSNIFRVTGKVSRYRGLDIDRLILWYETKRQI